MMRAISWAYCALTLLPVAANAGPVSYSCEIEGFRGTVGHPEVSQAWAELHADTTIAIDRTTGQVIHPGLGNINFDSINLIHPGDDERSFAAVAVAGGGNTVFFYEVQEWVESDQKPFTIVGRFNVYWGNCR